MSIQRSDNLPDLAERLKPHGRRPIRAFLRDPGGDEAPFWTIVYGRLSVDHATAVAVASELEHSTHTIAELLAGWRPAALAERAA
jgi:hypothetical protein